MKTIERNGEVHYHNCYEDSDIEDYGVEAPKKVSWLRVVMTLLVIIAMLLGLVYSVRG